MRKVHGWRRALRWTFGIFGGLIGFVGLVLLAAFIVFQTSWGRGVLRDQIQANMDKAFIGGAKVGRVEGNPLTELVLRDVVINGPDKKPAITVARLTVKLPLLPLISHQLRVQKVIADQLDVAITHDEYGRLNVANLTVKTEKKSLWNIALPNLVVHRGHVSIDDAGGEPLDVDNIELAVDAAMPLAGPMIADANVTGILRQKSSPFVIAASIYNDDESFQVKSMSARVGGVSAAIFGASMPKGAFSKAFSGTVAIVAPKAALRPLAPQVQVPGDVVLAISARPDGRLTYATINGGVGQSEIAGWVRADVQAKLATGYLSGGDLDLRALTQGKMTGHGDVLAAFDIDGSTTKNELPTARAIVTAWGHLNDSPNTAATIALTSDGEQIHATVGAASDAIRAGVGAVIRKHGDVITLESSHLVAVTGSLAAASGGKAPVRGSLDANLAASGQLAPKLDVNVAGHANGKKLRFNDIAVETLALNVDAKHVPSAPIGSGRVELGALRKGDIRFSKITLAAGNRPDGKLQVSVRSRPQPAPWAVDADALVAIGDTTVIDLQRHFVRAAGGSEWHGSTGEVRISPREIEVKDLRSESADGKLAVDATLGRKTGDIAANVDANFNLESLKKGYTGTVDAHIDVSRKRGKFEGVVTAKAAAVTLSPKSGITLDGNVKVEARADQLLANIDVASGKIGTAKIAVDVDAPDDVTNVTAWSTLTRSDIRTAEIKLSGIDLAQAAKAAGLQPMTGNIDGDIKIDATQAGGTIAMRNVNAPQLRGMGTVTADLAVSEPAKNELQTTVTARLIPTDVSAKDLTQNGESKLFAQAQFGAPDRLFDMKAWKALGIGAFKGATLRVDRLAFQPGTLERFGISTQMRGELGVGAEIDEAMKAVRFQVNLHGLRGGLIAQPVATNISGIVDEKSARGVVSVIADNTTVVRVQGSIPMSLDALRTNAKAAKNAPLRATVRIPQVPAKTLMNVTGTSQITGGVLDGTIDIAGTVAKPTVDAKLVATNVTVPPEEGKATQMIEKMTIVASWDGALGKVAIDGNSSGNGTLRVRAQANPDQLAAAAATIEAHRLDIAPLVAFMPGPAGGLGGRLDAQFALKGADPKTADLSGSLHITNGRIPIAPAVGTLFKGDLKVDVRNKNVNVKLLGKLGRGDVQLAASAPLDGMSPKSGKMELHLDKVQLIGTTEPILTGVITANLARVDETWRTTLRVERMTVKVPAEKGNKLSPVGAPKDVVFGGLEKHHGQNKGHDVPGGIVHDNTGPADFKAPSQVAAGADGEPHREPTSAPLLVAEIIVRNTFVESNELRGVVGGHLSVSVGEDKEVGIVGNMNVSRGVLDLFNRRYLVDKAQLHFDGSPDPRLDVRITHDFPEVTTITEVRGRMSKPELVLSSEPGTYSQAELLGFLLGGEPGGDPEMAPSAEQRVANAGASFLANKVGGYVKKALPVDVDVLRYEASSATESARVTVGTWITDTLFLAYRHHLEARPDENTGEAEVEYWIQRRLVVEGVVGDRGVNGADLLWRRRW